MISKNQVRQIKALHLKKNRAASELFLAEGPKLVKELLEHRPDMIKEVYASGLFLDENMTLIRKAKLKYNEVSESELKSISTQIAPSQALAVCKFMRDESPVYNFETGFSFYLDDIRDPGNFGTIIRLADWFGISSVFCSQNSCDIYHPKVIQSTMGAFIRVNVVYASLEDVIQKNLVKNVYGAVLNGKNIYGEKLEHGLIVIGNEANGIGSENMKLLNRRITIPSHQSSGTESLNAAMAASIIASEFFRQLKE